MTQFIEEYFNFTISEEKQKIALQLFEFQEQFRTDILKKKHLITSLGSSY